MFTGIGLILFAGLVWHEQIYLGKNISVNQSGEKPSESCSFTVLDSWMYNG